MKAIALALSLLGASVGFVPSPPANPAVAYPFAVGEEFEFSAKLGVLRLGTARMAVTGIDTVRGVESFVFVFGLDASAPFYKTSSVLTSWTGTSDMISRRFYQDLDENGKPKQRKFEIYPDSTWIQMTHGDTGTTVADPLDDTAFFYFLRTIPLEKGQTYKYNRYFRKDLNPVVIKVEKREEMELPDGKKVQCLVLNPAVGSDGLFAPRAEARLWLTDDDRRIPVQIKSKLPFGSVTLRLISMKLPDGTSAGS
ncbi:MAG TPA: DUF3108 domain-containing protein [Gemmatimonadales bacterium]|jgi:hypothetical protein